jgi:hypothetical protein
MPPVFVPLESTKDIKTALIRLIFEQVRFFPTYTIAAFNINYTFFRPENQDKKLYISS